MLNVGQWSTVLGTAFDVIGLLDSGRGARLEGERRKVEAQFAKEQADQDAVTVFASSQRDAIEQNRQADIVASRALAVAAASGGGASDPSVMKVISEIKGEGALRASMALYEGEAHARKLRISGLMSQLEGDNAVVAGANKEQSYRFHALGSTLKGAASLYSRYGIRSGDSALIDG